MPYIVIDKRPIDCKFCDFCSIKEVKTLLYDTDYLEIRCKFQKNIISQNIQYLTLRKGDNLKYAICWTGNLDGYFKDLLISEDYKELYGNCPRQEEK